MGTMFNQMFAVFAMLFTAAHQFMSALNNVATWTNEASGAFADTSRHDRNMALAKMMAEAGITELPKAIVAPTVVSAKKLAKVDSNPIELPA